MSDKRPPDSRETSRGDFVPAAEAELDDFGVEHPSTPTDDTPPHEFVDHDFGQS